MNDNGATDADLAALAESIRADAEAERDMERFWNVTVIPRPRRRVVCSSLWPLRQ